MLVVPPESHRPVTRHGALGVIAASAEHDEHVPGRRQSVDAVCDEFDAPDLRTVRAPHSRHPRASAGIQLCAVDHERAVGGGEPERTPGDEETRFRVNDPLRRPAGEHVAAPTRPGSADGCKAA